MPNQPILRKYYLVTGHYTTFTDLKFHVTDLSDRAPPIRVSTACWPLNCWHAAEVAALSTSTAALHRTISRCSASILLWKSPIHDQRGQK